MNSWRGVGEPWALPWAGQAVLCSLTRVLVGARLSPTAVGLDKVPFESTNCSLVLITAETVVSSAESLGLENSWSRERQFPYAQCAKRI